MCTYVFNAASKSIESANDNFEQLQANDNFEQLQATSNFTATSLHFKSKHTTSNFSTMCHDHNTAVSLTFLLQASKILDLSTSVFST